MGSIEALNQIARSAEVQALYQQTLLQSDLELRQAERRLAAQRRQQEEAVQAQSSVDEKQKLDMELNSKETPAPRKGNLGRILDIRA